MKSYDCIIVGAGSAGCTIARKLVHSGLNVALIDSNPKEKIGYPWEVTVERSVFGRIGLLLPPKSMWEEDPDVSRFFAEKPEDYVEVEDVNEEGFTLGHRALNQHLLDLAIESGVDLYEQHSALRLLYTNDSITGIAGDRKGLFGQQSFHMDSSLVIDATGIWAVLRRQVPDRYNIKKRLRKQDFAFGFQETREVSDAQLQRIKEEFELLPGMSATRIGKYHAYESIHVRKNNTVNLIFGSSISGSGSPEGNPSQQFHTRYPFFGKRVSGGGRLIPLRRALDTLVGNGFLCVGDSACQVIPTMGSGVASSMHAADIAARTITEAWNQGKIGFETLWAYNHKYQSKRGAILASYDIVRRFLQSMTLNQVTEVFHAGLLSNENFISTFSSNTITYDFRQIVEKLSRVFTNLGLVSLSLRFMQAMRDSQRAMNLYKEYPEEYDMEEFHRWQKKTDDLYENYRTFSKGEREVFL